MKCPSCNGMGTVMEWDADIDVQHYVEVVCYTCNGMGYLGGDE